MSQRIKRQLASSVNPTKWSVYRVLRIPSWGHSPEPWMAVAPGKGYGERFDTAALAFAYAEAHAEPAHEEGHEHEVCS